ncbi:hypothetical protein V1634_25835 [Plantactinospora veratri]|uniref:WXG100 family type VII secretion target n=1 Tax=Plantactinospora veratri TaxID=1436122 RepID=A0ABU7SL40_9ACTN
MTTPEQESQFDPMILKMFDQGVQNLERGIAEVQREWRALIDRINAALRRVYAEINDSIWASVAEWWTDKIAGLVKQIQQLVTEIGERVEKFFQTAQRAVAGAVPLGSLFAVANEWATRVQPPLSGLTGQMTGSGSVDSWRGPTKDTYEKRVQDQKEAVDNAVEKVKSTSGWLAKVAEENTTYMTGLGRVATDLVGQLTAVVIDATETGAGAVTQIVITLQHCSELIGTIVTESLNLALSLAERLAAVLTQINELAVEWGDRRGLSADGKWPQAVNA